MYAFMRRGWTSREGKQDGPGLDHSWYLCRVLPLLSELLYHCQHCVFCPQRLKTFEDPPCGYSWLLLGISRIIGANQRIIVSRAWQASHNRINRTSTEWATHA